MADLSGVAIYVYFTKNYNSIVLQEIDSFVPVALHILNQEVLHFYSYKPNDKVIYP